jgi:hypothetical protein
MMPALISGDLLRFQMLAAAMRCTATSELASRSINKSKPRFANTTLLAERWAEADER